MGQSLAKIYLHLTFSTKDRYPFIKTEWEEKLYAYIAGILKNLNSPGLIVNGSKDHIHILFVLSKNIALAQVVEILKKESSKWIKSQGYSKTFSWQTGYACFSISNSEIDSTKKYIRHQIVHHQKQSFQYELRNFLTEYNIDFNEKYIWN